MTNDEILKEIETKLEQKAYDPWNKYGCTIQIPIYFLHKLLEGIKNMPEPSCEETKKNTILEILEIMQNQADFVTTIPDAKIGDGITKNLAIIETIAVIKKHYRL